MSNPSFLRTEYAVTPMGIDAQEPRFSWSSADEQVAYQIRCASSPCLLRSPDLWDSGRIESGERVFVRYAGVNLKSRQRVYWSVRVWNERGEVTESEPTWFEMGLLDRSDWEGEFLSVPCNGGGGRGYLSRSFPEGAPFELWAQIDLGRRKSFDRFVLWPVRCPELGEVAGNGFGFPARFRIEGSEDVGFSAPSPLVETAEDLPNPGGAPWEFRLPAPVAFRFVRLTVLKPGDVAPAVGAARFFALDEFQIFRGETNLAFGNAVHVPNAHDSKIAIGAYDWHPDCLTDGIIHPREVRRDEGGGNLLRRVFTLDKPVARARASIASRGFYELCINRKKAGDAVLDSAWTVDDKRLLYSTWDCGESLREGTNVVSILVGNGWTLSPAVILQLDVEHPDGSTSQLCTDSEWRLLPGPVRENNLFHGEIYDAGMDDPSVFSPSFDDHAFPYAEVLVSYRPALSAQMQPPIRVVETIPALSLTQPQPGVWVFDFGKNFSGWVRLQVPGGERRELKLRFAETIFDDGSVWTDTAQTQARDGGLWANFQKRYILYRGKDEAEEAARRDTVNGMINNTNYRVARATDRYLTSGVGSGTTWEPRFVYHGFRFAELTNYPGTPALDTVSGRVVHTDLRKIGHFESSNTVLNWAWDAARQTLLNNLHSVPTDCCQRDERQGWAADIHVASEAMLLSFDAASTYSKWLRDARDCQREDGAFSDTVPYSLGWIGEDIGWDTSSVLVAWYSYLHTGDTRILADHFPGMCRYLDFLEKSFPDHFAGANAHYGDWLSLEETPVPLVENALWYQAVCVTSLSAAALGNFRVKEQLDETSRKIAGEFHRRFFDVENGCYGNGSQTSQVLPLRLGIVPTELRQTVFKSLVGNVERCGRHGLAGVIGSKSLLEVLCEEGRSDLAFAIASTEEYPGWGYMKAHGATTMWEHWEHLTGPGMNSHNHPVFAHIAGWLMKYVAGIRPSPESPGFRTVVLAPVFPEGLDHASGELQTLVGQVRTSWRREGGAVVVEAELPVGSSGNFQAPWTPCGQWVIEGDGASSQVIPSDGPRHFRAKLRIPAECAADKKSDDRPPIYQASEKDSRLRIFEFAKTRECVTHPTANHETRPMNTHWKITLLLALLTWGVGLCAAEPPAEKLSDGLLGYWRFEDPTTDSFEDSSQNNAPTVPDGIYCRPKISQVPGKVGQGLAFDGTGDHWGLGLPLDNNEVGRVHKKFCMAFWIMPLAWKKNVEEGDKTFNEFVRFDGLFMVELNRLEDDARCGEIGFYVRILGGWALRSAKFALPLNEWTFVAWNFDSVEGGQLFINGEAMGNPVRSADDDAEMVPDGGGNSPSNIGSTNTNAAIDEFAVWGRTLGDAEIHSLYNRGKGISVLPLK